MHSGSQACLALKCCLGAVGARLREQDAECACAASAPCFFGGTGAPGFALAAAIGVPDPAAKRAGTAATASTSG
jgi:hypothetical protein